MANVKPSVCQNSVGPWVSKVIGSTHLDIIDDKLVEPIWHDVFGLLVASIADTGHPSLTSESSSHRVVNTLRLTPVWL